MKRTSVRIKTATNHLDDLGLTLAEAEADAKYLCDCFGRRYPSLFPTTIQSQDLPRISYTANTLRRVSHCAGFKRLIESFGKNTYRHHLFSARCAAFLEDRGYEVEFEPPPSTPGGKGPDLLVSHGSDELFASECKTFDIKSLYKEQRAKAIADILYMRVRTCDQLDLFLLDDLAAAKVEESLRNDRVVSEIYKSTLTSDSASIQLECGAELRVMRKPPIVGGEDDFPTVTLMGFLESIDSGVREPGFAFLRGGRSVGVWGPPPSFRQKLNRKRRDSKRQGLDGLPFIVLLDGDEIIGDPEENRRFFERDWLNARNTQFSGVGVLRSATSNGQPPFVFIENRYADCPINL